MTKEPQAARPRNTRDQILEAALAMIERMQPWIELVEEALRKGLGQTPLAALVPLRDLAYAVVTFYLGVNLVTHLDEGGNRTEALFTRFEQLAPLLGALLPGGS